MGLESGTQKVHIVDDDAAIRQSLVGLMESVQLATACYASASEFLEKFGPHVRGCVLLDMRMPKMSGLELQKALKDAGCSIPIIFLTGHGEVSAAVQALKEGAFDFIEKPYSSNRLVERVQAALAWETGDRDRAAQAAAIVRRFETCTPREMQVMERLVAGASNKQVADDLDISTKTVEVHRARLMEKTGAQSFAELVRLAVALETARQA